MSKSFADIVCENRVLSGALLEQFHRTFHVSLMDFWDNLTGFDVIAFDDWLEAADNGSAYDVAQARYGDTGVAIIEKAIRRRPLDASDFAEARKRLPAHFVDRARAELETPAQ